MSQETEINTEEQSQSEAGTPADSGVTEANVANDAQAKAAEILAARSKGKTKTAKEPKEPKAPSEPKEPKAPKVEGVIKTGYKFLRDIDPTVDKLNPQQSIIIAEMLKLRGTEGQLQDVVLREPLMKALQESAMVTRQPHERVFGFYLNSWKKDTEGTEKKAAIPALFEVVKVQFKD